MENDDIPRLTAAMRTVCAELDALSRGDRAPDTDTNTDPALIPGSEAGPQAGRYREAVRGAVRALETSQASFDSQEFVALRGALEALLQEVPR